MRTRINIARSHLVVAILMLALVAAAGCSGDSGSRDQAAGTGSADAQMKQDHSGHDHPAGEHPVAEHPTGEHPTGEHPTGEHPAAGAHDHSAGTMLAGVHFTPPAGWQDLGASGMRQAQYRLDPVSGDSAQGEVNVFYFGASSGGGVQANLDRWIGQMILPDGADPATAISRDTFTADGMPGHIVSLNGSYKSGGGRPMGGGGTIMPGYRLVGVVVEGPQGSLFFKLTGPEKTARAMESDLLAMVKSAHK